MKEFVNEGDYGRVYCNLTNYLVVGVSIWKCLMVYESIWGYIWWPKTSWENIKIYDSMWELYVHLRLSKIIYENYWYMGVY